MGQFEILRDVRATPEQVWRVVTDWNGFARWMPLTTMRVDDGPSRVGFGFTGLSGVGRLRFADSMVVTRWSPPADGTPLGHYRVRKTGWLLVGWAVVEVGPGAAAGHTRLRWVEDITLRPEPLGRLVAPLVDRGNVLMFGRAVDAMVAEAEASVVR
jgi:uncharacterized protein YndB with AHSA1/START domain